MQFRLPHVALFLAVTASACISDNVLDPNDRPNPPPAAAFDADFSFFEGRAPAPGGGTTAWTQARQAVGNARSAMAVLEVPEALLRAAGAEQGTRDGQAWRWPFSTTVGGDLYVGELRSQVVRNQYEWNLWVSSIDHSPPLSDYLWAVGQTSAAGFDGVWSLADAEAGTDSVAARVSWVRNSADGVNFGFLDSDTAVWTYERTSSAGIALTYVVHSAPEARVTWNTATGTGTSWTPATSTSCWNQALHDVAC